MAGLLASAGVALLMEKAPREPLAFRLGRAPSAPRAPGYPVRGRVTHLGVAVPGAEIQLAILGRGKPPIQVTTVHAAFARSGDDGRFQFSDVPAGPLRLAVIAKGLAPSFRAFDLPADPAGVDVLVELDAGAVLEGCLMSAGTPVAGARVSTWLTGLDAQMDRRPLRVATSDAEGRYRMEGFDPARPIRLVILADGFRPVEHAYRTPGEAPDRFDLDPGLAAWGRIVTTSGAPLDGAQVTAGQGEAYPAETRTDSSGEARIGGLIGRPVTLRVSKDGYAPARLELPAPSAGWTVVLRQNGGLAGRAPDAAWLVIVREGETYRRPIAKDGSFQWEGLPPGPAEVRSTLESGRVLAVRKVEIPEGEIAGGILLKP